MFKFRSIKIFTLITIITVVLYVIASAAIISAINIYVKKLAYNEAVEKSQVILDKNLSIHSFYSKTLKPDLFNTFKNSGIAAEFDPVWMSSTFAIREINKIYYQLRTDNKNYYYKEAAVNARSSENEADSFEREFLYNLNIDPNLSAKEEIRYFNNEPFLTVLRRGEQLEESCLQCHSTPDKAPAGLVKIYGPEKSFNRIDGEIISAISIRIPLSYAYKEANNFSIILGAILLCLIAIIVAIQLLINKLLIFKPISIVGKIASEIVNNKSKLGQEIKGSFGKEIRDLTESFNKMSVSLKEERENLEEKIEERSEELRLIAYYDSLTGLPNRTLLYDHIKNTIAKAKRNKEKFAILLFDVDNFKEINDSMGHDIGDELLNSIPKYLDLSLRESDIFARLGGDEFVIIVSSVNSEKDAFKVAEKIKASLLNLNISHEKGEFTVTVSVGISVYPEDGEDIPSLMKNADIAMYSAKRSGKNTYKRFNVNMID